MDLRLIERLIGLVERSRVTELDYSEGATRILIRRQGSDPPVRDEAAASEPVAVSASVEHVLAAGLFGTFYRAPAPDQPPFVTEGDVVGEGQVLAILEAMKVFNRVECDRAGRIARVLAENGATVEAGTPLFAIAPA